MQNKFVLKRRSFLILAAVGALPFWSVLKNCRNSTSQSEREQIMQKIPLVSQCVGRLLIDVPQDSETYYNYQNYKGWSVELIQGGYSFGLFD